MFILKAMSSPHNEIILHCRGFSNAEGVGFKNGEGIFELAETDKDNYQVLRQVGVVEIKNEQAFFNYTDPEFKQLINYNEETGYSSLDGGAWEVRGVHYLNAAGEVDYTYKAPTAGLALYISAKNPFSYIGNPFSFFSSKEQDEQTSSTSTTANTLSSCTNSK